MLAERLREAGIGCCTQKAATLLDLAWAGLDLRACGVDALEAIKGIGAKTARFFLMHSRAGVRHAAIDTHILKHLALHGVDKLPKTTPPKGPVYTRLEGAFLAFSRQGRHVASRL